MEAEHGKSAIKTFKEIGLYSCFNSIVSSKKWSVSDTKDAFTSLLDSSRTPEDNQFFVTLPSGSNRIYRPIYVDLLHLKITVEISCQGCV